jgi:hypothetical protein
VDYHTDPKFQSPEKEGEMWRRVGDQPWTSCWFLLKDGSLYVFGRKGVRTLLSLTKHSAPLSVSDQDVWGVLART